MAFKLVPIKVKVNALNGPAMIAGVRKAVEQTADDAIRDLKAPVSGWKHPVQFEKVPVKDGVIVGTEDEIYQYQDEGTRPHPIVPRNAKVLRFPAGGGIVYTRRVRHPGTKPRGWSQMIATKYQRELPLRINEAIGAVIGAGS